MKATELRIGDIVFDRRYKLLRIDEISEISVCMREGGSAYTEEFEYLRPVPPIVKWACNIVKLRI
jgi:hypothetical protein